LGKEKTTTKKTKLEDLYYLTWILRVTIKTCVDIEINMGPMEQNKVQKYCT
jgi:hypothetical protein